MDTFKVLKGFLVLAVAFLGFIPSAASAAYAPCQETVASSGNLVSEKLLPIDCSAAAVSVYSQMTGTYLPGLSGGDFLGAEASVYGHMTGTYLPGLSGGDFLGALASASAADTQAP